MQETILGCDQRHSIEKCENEIRKDRKTTTQLFMKKHALGAVSLSQWGLSKT